MRFYGVGNEASSVREQRPKPSSRGRGRRSRVRYKPLRKMHGGWKEPKAQVVATSHQRFRSRGGRAIQVITGWGDVKAKRVF